MGEWVPWIDIEKTRYGFEYRVGYLVVARAQWIKLSDGWRIQLLRMPTAPTRDGMLILADGGMFKNPQDLFDELRRLMKGP